MPSGPSVPAAPAGSRREARQAALRAALAGAGLDAWLVTDPPGLRYLTGFTGSAGLVYVDTGRTLLITDFRYAAQAPAEAGTVADIAIDRHNVWERLAALVGGPGRRRVGIASERITVRDLERLRGIAGCEPVPGDDRVGALRMVKDAGEVAAIAAAATLAQEALAEVLPTIRVGETEAAIGARLEQALRIRGSEWHPFQTIVAGGPRSALPHAHTTARPVGRGEFLLLDFGAQVDGYCADLTRTVVVGASADGRQREIHQIVRESQRIACDGIRPGMTGREADALARDVIAAAGFGDAFGHSLGHGLGLEVHEAPRLARTAEDPLPAGAVVTIEPGIYLEGWGGVRLEDDLHLAPEGPRLLSDQRTELLELR